MTSGYFKRFCSSIDNSEQCQRWADETERGDRTQESLYEELLNKYGEEAVAQAHVTAMKETEEGNATTEQQPDITQTVTSKDSRPTAQQRSVIHSPIVQPKIETPIATPTTTATAAAAAPQNEEQHVTNEVIMQKVEELQKRKEEERKQEDAKKRTLGNEQRAKEGISTPKPAPPPQRSGHIPAAPSNLEDVCRVCVTPPTMAILEVLKLWYTGEDAKFIEDIVDRVGREDILLEEALAQVFIKDKNSLDGIERTLQDFNEVLAEALRIAASKSPELKAHFDRERAELEGGEEKTPSEEGSG